MRWPGRRMVSQAPRRVSGRLQCARRDDGGSPRPGRCSDNRGCPGTWRHLQGASESGRRGTAIHRRRRCGMPRLSLMRRQRLAVPCRWLLPRRRLHRGHGSRAEPQHRLLKSDFLRRGFGRLLGCRTRLNRRLRRGRGVERALNSEHGPPKCRWPRLGRGLRGRLRTCCSLTGRHPEHGLLEGGTGTGFESHAARAASFRPVIVRSTAPWAGAHWRGL
jgi:hypothetical protein